MSSAPAIETASTGSRTWRVKRGEARMKPLERSRKTPADRVELISGEAIHGKSLLVASPGGKFARISPPRNSGLSSMQSQEPINIAASTRPPRLTARIRFFLEDDASREERSTSSPRDARIARARVAIRKYFDG